SEVVQVLVDKTLDAAHAPLYQRYVRFMRWVDGERRLRVRANADQPDQGANAVAFGAEGVGLCRTEHMFFGEGKIGPMRETILAGTAEERRTALAKLLPLQRADFAGLFRVMNDRPVTIRTLDPPLHEFLPHDEAGQRRVAAEVMREKGTRFRYLVGTMIEIPRGALTADEIASVAEFFSFGTNDLTQTTLGVSRDDAGRFLVPYVDRFEIYDKDPFETIDRAGVGALMHIASEKGRARRPKLKLGICGEHGGDPATVRFCHEIGLDYVSCSPFRVPIARLAAARAALGAG